MPIGGNSTLGLRAKVEAQVDRQSQRKITKDVEKAIGDAEDVSPGMGGGFKGRTTPSADGSRGGGLGTAGTVGAVGAAKGGASKVGGMLGGGAIAGGAAILGTVALGGALANRMLGAMTAASGEMQATGSILGAAMDLFFKPFGDFLGNLFRPMAKGLLGFAASWAKLTSEDGLAIGGIKAIVDGIINLPNALGSIIVQTMGQVLESLFGDNEFFTELQNFEFSDYITPLQSWTMFINPFMWADWITKLPWRDWIDPIDWGDWINDINWNAILPSVSAQEVLDFIFGGGGGNSGGNGGGGGRFTGSGGINRPGVSDDPFDRFQSGGSGFDVNPFQPGNQDLNLRLEADGRRLWETTRRSSNDLLDRI